jgi:hypothetical protein
LFILKKCRSQTCRITAGWVYTLIDCPCDLPEVTLPAPGEPWNSASGDWVFQDPFFLVPKYHRGATTCVRSKYTASGAGQQCCYDWSKKLITWGPGAGTLDKVSPGFFDKEEPEKTHQIVDVDGDVCDRWAWSHAVRPPNKGLGCSRNPSLFDDRFPVPGLKCRGDHLVWQF